MHRLNRILATALISLLGASCATNPKLDTQAPKVTQNQLRVETTNPEMQRWAYYHWNKAAIITRLKLQQVEARDWRAIEEVQQNFGVSDETSIQTVENVLRKMDRKFHNETNTIRFFDNQNVPDVLAQRAGPNSRGVNAYTTLGGNILSVNQDLMHDEPLKMIVHEMTHMAARTSDHAYITLARTYWSPESGHGRLSPEKRLENADTYTAFITQYF